MGSKYVRLSSGDPRPEDARKKSAQLLLEFGGLALSLLGICRNQMVHTAPTGSLPMPYPIML